MKKKQKSLTIYILPLLILLLALFYIYARFIEPNTITTNISTIESKYIDKNLENLTIIQFSDTHLSKYYTLDKLQKVVDLINSYEPDLVFFTGDLIDDYKTLQIPEEDISEKLSKINARLGKFSVYGNHDYGGGAQKIYRTIMKDSGFELLINESVYLDKYNLTITGLDDAIFGNPDIEGINSNFRESCYNLLLCHEPDIIDYIPNYKFDLTISGHSHGEQINLPFLDNFILPPFARNYVRGLYEINNERDSKIYVNKGLGTSKIPLRFLAKPEITLFNLKNN